LGSTSHGIKPLVKWIAAPGDVETIDVAQRRHEKSRDLTQVRDDMIRYATDNV
jgi:hypothetical protein